MEALQTFTLKVTQEEYDLLIDSIAESCIKLVGKNDRLDKAVELSHLFDNFISQFCDQRFPQNKLESKHDFKKEELPDWYLKLKHANLTLEEWSRLSYFALNYWKTGPCGSIYMNTPRDSKGQPLDNVLKNLAIEFHKTITKCEDAHKYYSGTVHGDNKPFDNKLLNRYKEDALNILNNIDRRYEALKEE